MGGCGKHGILRPVPSRFWSSEGSHEEPSKDPSEGTVEGSPAGCFSQAAQRQRARSSVATATVASKARASCVFHRLHVVCLFTPFRPPNKTARTGCQPRCRRPRRRPIQCLNVVWRRDLCSSAERKNQQSWQSCVCSGAADGLPAALPTWTPPLAKGVKLVTQKLRCRRPSGQHTQLHIEQQQAALRRRRVRRTAKAPAGSFEGAFKGSLEGSHAV